MRTSIYLFSEKADEIKKFLELYYSKNFSLPNNLTYKEDFETPIDMIEIISCFIDNNDKFEATLWINIDKNVYILVTNNNLDSLIKYFYERYPY